jgi:RimJ/RimL family protein N-acetyltransferase
MTRTVSSRAERGTCCYEAPVDADAAARPARIHARRLRRPAATRRRSARDEIHQWRQAVVEKGRRRSARTRRTLLPKLVWPGVWHATRRDTGAFIGWYCLKYCPPTCDVEVGYRLLREAWGQGFATEGATELVRYGYDDLGLDKIIGVTHPGNRASQRVLMKAGLDDAGYARRYYGRRLRLFVGHRDARQGIAA